MSKKGFTLIELMIVVAIIGILSAIAIPKFADLIRKSNEGATRGNLSTIKSAISIYYSENEGEYPGVLDTALTNPPVGGTGGKYLKEIPRVNIPPYGGVATVRQGTEATLNANFGKGWGYNTPNSNTGAIEINAVSGTSSAKSLGDVWVDATNTDSKGTVWYTY